MVQAYNADALVMEKLRTYYAKVDADGTVQLIQTIRTFRGGKQLYQLEDEKWYEACELTFNQPIPKHKITFTLADLEDVLKTSIEAGYINEYGAHRIKDLLKTKQKI